MKLRIVVVGRDKGDPIVDASNEYLGRLTRYFPAEIVEVKEEPLKKKTPTDRIKRLEAERIEKATFSDGRLILLDERGKTFGSEALAKKIGDFARDGVRVSLVIGGPAGLDKDLIRRADETWALSKMTLPHRVARLILTEQLYRAATILRGEPYHK